MNVILSFKPAHLKFKVYRIAALPRHFFNCIFLALQSRNLYGPVVQWIE